jgi:calcineurin-like phosphoesterase family protein
MVVNMINDISNTWFISDTHYNHLHQNKQGEQRGVILFERTQFKTIKEHDDTIDNLLFSWAEKHYGAILFHLGDFGNIDHLWVIRKLRWEYGIECHFVMGNHDARSELDRFQRVFDKVYTMPVYIHPRIIISHEPVWPCPAGTLNVHGHLHCERLDSEQHFNVNVHMLNYQLASSKRVMNLLGKLEKPSFKFLEEPYVRHMLITQKKEDAVYDRKTGKIDYEASVRLYNKNHPDHPKQPIPKHTLSW